jgi:hypothetical protein
VCCSQLLGYFQSNVEKCFLVKTLPVSLEAFLGLSYAYLAATTLWLLLPARLNHRLLLQTMRSIPPTLVK